MYHEGEKLQTHLTQVGEGEHIGIGKCHYLALARTFQTEREGGFKKTYTLLKVLGVWC